MDFRDLERKGLHIAHITDDESGSCYSSSGGYRFLWMEVAPSKDIDDHSPAFQFSSYNKNESD